MKKIAILAWSDLQPLNPTYALVADGRIEGEDLICGLHDWDYRYKTGVNAYNPEERLYAFKAWVEDGQVWVDENEIGAWLADNPQSYNRDQYKGLYKDLHGGSEEPHFVKRICHAYSVEWSCLHFRLVALANQPFNLFVLNEFECV
jgi:hypothetical protein